VEDAEELGVAREVAEEVGVAGEVVGEIEEEVDEEYSREVEGCLVEELQCWEEEIQYFVEGDQRSGEERPCLVRQIDLSCSNSCFYKQKFHPSIQVEVAFWDTS